MTDIFKQQRAPISPGEFDGGGTDDEGSINAMRGHLNTMTETPPPQIQQQMSADHPLANQSEAAVMYQNAKRMLKERQQQPEVPFNPNFNPQQGVSDPRFAQFRDPKFEEAMRKLNAIGYDEVELPSKGKFYLRGEGPGNGILHIRPMTGREDQILTTPRFVKRNQALNMIFKECIGEQINPELLLSEDRTFLLIYLRGISHSPFYDVEVKCPNCTKVFQTKINLNALEVENCPDDYGPDSLTDTLPNSGFNIRYRLSTGKDETMVQEYKDKRIQQFGDQVADDTTLYRAAVLIEEIAGVTNRMMIQNILERLPINDVAYIRELLNEPPFGVNTKVGIICPHCSHEFIVDMPMELGFFFPNPKSQKKKQQQA